ncbi:hypothetical protein [Halopenitus malekzadehii]|uniref:hypothetical protein n=1 Tax=Halopenitus malekzadehii TaxID=1267564 RepID=UPI00116000DD|nr:hypothetical protein [Halopenitus malekzadehii]
MTNCNEIDSDSRCGVDVVDPGQKTLVYVLCDDCDGIDEMLIVDDSRDSNQTQEVTETYSAIMERHSDKTDHHIQMGITEGYEIDLVHIARAVTS